MDETHGVVAWKNKILKSIREHIRCKKKNHPTEQLATDLLAPRLLVIQNAVGSGEHDDTELRRRGFEREY